MKKKVMVDPIRKKERELSYIPVRYIIAILFVVLETLAVIAVMTFLTIYIPYFYFAVVITQFGVAIAIINSNDNPDYKLPWLFFVMLIPIVGFMLYFMFYSRKLNKKQVKRMKQITTQRVAKDDTKELQEIQEFNEIISSQAIMLNKLSDSHVYGNTDMKYFPIGEELFASMVEDLKKAERFIFMEYFIIEGGLFWNTILEILKEKVAKGVEVRVVYDDIGCMMTLPGNYYKQLQKLGIKSVPFARLRGQANNEFNNRSHRKITVIDGKVGYTGGVNIADEYINHIKKFGHWKDVGIRLEGEAVNELTRLFLIDYAINNKKSDVDFSEYYCNASSKQEGYCIPFGDGPKPIYHRQVSKSVILNMLNQSKEYVYITTPYLIIDNELVQALENTAMRGVDVRIITPHIPDKKLVFLMTRSHYNRLMSAGVKIYEYESGFVHAKTYLSDDETAMVGTINMDYRSLVHHFENGVWIYKHKVIEDIKKDFLDTQEKSIQFEKGMVKGNLFQRFIRAMAKVFSPLF
ncbi:MAG: cardiolipin synthase [Anaeroplasmataceae bacterium]|nr:cardiolipin synthase [Anaeroplasmataceae bacterium]MDE7384671.1 cardiolipin synthase [Anaeroplasmataceae bacterium]